VKGGGGEEGERERERARERCVCVFITILRATQICLLEIKFTEAWSRNFLHYWSLLETP
jgi:hypothetical protein